LKSPRGELLIREITPADAETAAQLATELGYPADIAQMRERIERVKSSAEQVVYVACVSGVVVGWIDAAVSCHLATGAVGEIGGLIVASEHRGCGTGQELINHAERWVAGRGIGTMVVRSRTTREVAHRFYLREGYALTKTSAVFSKQLKSAKDPDARRASI
jgi:GNAT superfamily N-acetyltransferase